MQQVKNSSNPTAFLQNILSQNPMGAQLINLLNSGNLQQMAQFMAQQQNVDLNALINELQN